MLDFPNGPEGMVRDMLRGMTECYPERCKLLGTNVVMSNEASPDRVAVIASGGGGGEPQFAGAVGSGLADAVCVGNFRAAPNAYALYEAGMLLGRKHGTLLVYNNFSGDVLNNDMAAELLSLDGVEAKSVTVSDDIASARGEAKEERGGLCGVLFVLKIAAEASRRGLSLDECHRLAGKANSRLGSVSLVWDEASREFMIGSGFSGEPPLSRTPDRDAVSMAKRLCKMIADDISPKAPERLEILINRLCCTTFMEGFAFANIVRDAFRGLGHEVGRVRVGNYFNPVMAEGYYLSVLSADEELRGYLDKTAYTESFSL